MSVVRIITQAVDYLAENALTVSMAGFIVMMLANPVTYMQLALLPIDIQNLFGASIDRQGLGLSINNDNLIFGAMSYVAACGYVILLAGVLLGLSRMIKARK